MHQRNMTTSGTQASEKIKKQLITAQAEIVGHTRTIEELKRENELKTLALQKAQDRNMLLEEQVDELIERLAKSPAPKAAHIPCANNHYNTIRTKESLPSSRCRSHDSNTSTSSFESMGVPSSTSTKPPLSFSIPSYIKCKHCAQRNRELEQSKQQTRDARARLAGERAAKKAAVKNAYLEVARAATAHAQLLDEEV